MLPLVLYIIVNCFDKEDIDRLFNKQNNDKFIWHVVDDRSKYRPFGMNSQF